MAVDISSTSSRKNGCGNLRYLRQDQKSEEKWRWKSHATLAGSENPGGEKDVEISSISSWSGNFVK